MDFLNLSTLELSQIQNINSEMEYLYRKKRKKRKFRVKDKSDTIDLSLFRQGNIRAGVNIFFNPGFIESLEKYGDNIEFIS